MNRKVFFLGLILILSFILLACSFSSKAPASAGGDPTALQTQVPATPPSDSLINEAQAKGEISSEAALVYKVFAQFSDPRLPSVYKGSANLGTDSHIVDYLQARYSSLSPQAQELMIPFLVPPIYKGSWADRTGQPLAPYAPPAPDKSPTPTVAFDPNLPPDPKLPPDPNLPTDPGREGPQTTPFKKPLPCEKINTDDWDYKSGMHSPVRFWWLKDRSEDSAVVDRMIVAMDDDIWPKLTGLMGHTPIPDGNTPCNGGSPDFDVYVTPDVARSSAPSISPPGCRETPSYILLNPGVSDAILAHEFMHAIQWSYNTSAACMYPGDYAWMAEATAAWAQDYVYPQDNEEHGYVDWFFAPPDVPTLPLKNDSHEYGAYLFFFYLTNHFDKPGIVSDAWANTTSSASLPALDKAIPGGLDKAWGDFAIDNIDEPPQDDYQVWDNLNTKPSGNSLIKGVASPNNTYDLTPDLSPLTIYYEWFTFSETSRLVTFFNGLSFGLDEEPINTYMGTLPIDDGTTQYKFTDRASADTRGLKIQAYFRVQGDTDWQLEDWTDKHYMSFCRDASSERLTDLVIVVSNSSQDASITRSGAYPSRVQVSDVGCWRYGGDASALSSGQGEGGDYNDHQTIPNVAFERTETHPNIPYPYLTFNVVEGKLDRTYDYASSDGDCVGNGESHSNLGNSSINSYLNHLYILYGAVSGPSVRRYSGTASTGESVTVNFQCPDGSGPQPMPGFPWFYADVLSQIKEKVYTVSTSGDMIGSGDLLEDVSNAHMIYKWNFKSLAETSGSDTSSLDGSGSGSSGQNNASGGNGSAPQAPGSSYPADIPRYPNIEISNQPQPGMVVFTTSDAMEKVAEFFKDAYTKLGWTDNSQPIDPSAQSFQLVFLKGSAITMVVISDADGKTFVSITKVGG